MNSLPVDYHGECRQCKWWREGEIAGRCHRFPACVMKTSGDWCGEWALRQREGAKTDETERPGNK